MVAMQNAHGLVIGIAQYRHINRLPSVKDSEEITKLLTDPMTCGYPKNNVKHLRDERATRTAIRRGLSNLVRRCDRESTVFLYFSGHGGRIESGPGTGQYLLPVDVVYLDDEALVRTAISGTEFSSALNAIPARKLIVVFDCCHAGGIGRPKGANAAQIKAGLSETYYDSLRHGRGRAIFASSRETEYSYILPGSECSLFTQHLLVGLRGGAPGPGGVIRVCDLFHYLQPRVTADHPGQHPIFKAEIEENFPVALHLGGTESAPAPQPPADGFVYDVFISYRQKEPDKSWVRKTLVPRLQQEGVLVFVDYQDFSIGAPLVLEMARGVEQCRYTLAILSPQYLKSNFTELESVLAEHLGLEQTQRRLLAVLREDCKPRLGMRARLWLDMTEEGEFEANIARLSYELRRSPEE